MDFDIREILPQDRIYPMLIAALTEKRPLPPADWSVVKLGEEILTSGSTYEPDLFLRQADALRTAVYYLVDFASRMPEWINTSESNERVKEMCCELAAEIETITVRPDEIIAERGKLKSWLKAILSVQTCWIYREEIERVRAHDREIKRKSQLSPPKENPLLVAEAKQEKWQSVLAKNIWQKASGRTQTESSDQPRLF